MNPNSKSLSKKLPKRFPKTTFTSLSGEVFPSHILALTDDGYYEHAKKLAALSGPWGYGAGEVVVVALYRLLKKGEMEMSLETPEALSPQAQEALNWMFSDEVRWLTIKELKDRVEERWGEAVNRELMEFSKNFGT